MKKIGFNEEFELYIKVDFKRTNDLVRALEDAGFATKINDAEGNDDQIISVTVTPFTAASAHMIMNNIK